LNLQADNTSLPPQKKRRDKRAQILEAGGKLVIDQGFSAVTMVEIAELAKVSRATLYRYYSTKDQIYNDIAIEWGLNFISAMRQSPPQDPTVGGRISTVIEKAVSAAADNPRLMASYVAILISEDELLQHDHRRFKGLMPGIIKIAIGKSQQPRLLQLASSTLQHMLLSNLISLNVGTTDGDTVTHEMKQLAEELLSDVWDKR
jgi:AcrR family transcriptional regulator